MVADVLNIGGNDAGKTQIMYGAHPHELCSDQKYLWVSCEPACISALNGGIPSVTYQVTKKGLRLLAVIA